MFYPGRIAVFLVALTRILFFPQHVLGASELSSVRNAAQQTVIANRFLERVFEVRDGRVRTLALVNKLDGRRYDIDSNEFLLEIVWERLMYEHESENPVSLTASDFTLRDHKTETLSDGEQRLWFQLENPKYNLEVRISYSLRPNEFFTRKWLEIRSVGTTSVFLHRIAVENFAFQGVAARLGGFGQPLYARNVFLGLEYPAAYNTAEGNWIRAAYYAGETTGSQYLRTESAVMGVAEEGSTRSAFLNYVSRIRSGKVRPVVVFNTWYDMQKQALNTSNCLQRMSQLKKKLLDPYGIRLNSFALDDAWDNRDSVWEIGEDTFQGDFTPLVRAFQQSGTGLGLWIGPVGGYGGGNARRIQAGRKLGYEVSANGKYFCIAGSRYHEKLKNTLVQLVQKYSVNHLKFDGVAFGCAASGHGHLPGIYSRDAQVRAFIDILKTIRAADPRVFLNNTTGTWLSPWWLMYTDTAWFGGFDYGFLNGVPAISERDKAITYRDKWLHDNLCKHESQFPQSSLMTVGIIKGTLGSEGGLVESLASWARTVVMHFSRGTMLTELYISPGVFSDDEWRTLGTIMRWAHRNSEILLGDTRWVLGNPEQGEVYGYAHFSGARGIVTLRNPLIEERTVAVALDHSVGLAQTAVKLRAKVVYPYTEVFPVSLKYGDAVPVTIQGYEVIVIEIFPEDSIIQPVPVGVRYEPVSSDETSIRYSIYGHPGPLESIQLVPSNGVQGVEAGKRAASVDLRAPQARVGFSPVTTESDFGFRLHSLSRREDNRGSLVGSLTLTMPRNADRTKLAILYKPSEAGGQVSARLTNNKEDVKLEMVSADTSLKELAYGKGNWQFFLAPLSGNPSQIGFVLSSVDKKAIAGGISVWALGDFRLAREVLRVILKRPQPRSTSPADPMLAASSAIERRVIHLFTRQF